jgi:hypothetical protein
MAAGNHEIGSQAKLHCSRGCSKGKEKGIVLTILPELQHGEGMGSGVFCAWWMVEEGALM